MTAEIKKPTNVHPVTGFFFFFFTMTALFSFRLRVSSSSIALTEFTALCSEPLLFVYLIYVTSTVRFLNVCLKNVHYDRCFNYVSECFGPGGRLHT